MAEASIPVDLLNPGQVFACIGLMEAAEILLGGVEGVYDWSDPNNTRFHVRASGAEHPVKTVLEFLHNAQVVALHPAGQDFSRAWGADWPKQKSIDPADGYPFTVPKPDKPATLACQLEYDSKAIPLFYWGDSTSRDNAKFWAGSRGYPGAMLAKDALELIKESTPGCDLFIDPFSLSAPQSSSFRFDWRRDYIPIQAGFSPNQHPSITMCGYPLVEILAALGMQNARPFRPHRRNKLLYHYCVTGRDQSRSALWLPLELIRASLGGQEVPFPHRTFRMAMGWPGQEGQARCITTVTEEH